MPRRVLILVLAAALSLTACQSTTPSPHKPVTTTATLTPAAVQRYVALGDSTVAGPVLRPQRPRQPAGCARSQVNFVSLLATSLRVERFVDASCSGARTADLLTSHGEAPAQLRSVTAATDLVTLGPIGANDIGLVGALTRCIFGDCGRELRGLDGRVAAIGPPLRRALAAIHRRAPGAAVLVIGYGRYLPTGACPAVEPVSATDGNHAQRLLSSINRVLAAAAQRAGARYVDLATMPGSAEHTTCANSAQRWYAGIAPADPDGALPYHPTKLGMKAVAAHLAAVLR
ncbi:MAG: SGNH/GDSL hydrolase family protein [Marmoricola sp.]